MDNMINTNFNRKLPVPKEIKEQYPLSAEATAKKEIRDKEIKEVFTGESDKLALGYRTVFGRPSGFGS